MTPQRYQFEGNNLTVREIMVQVPRLGDATIRKHLANGRNTRAAMLNFSPHAACVRAGRLGKLARAAAGFDNRAVRNRA